MGQFSWFTQDTHHRIVSDERKTVYLVDGKGNKWKEDFYEGYGVFGGKDFYELLAEMNGYSYKEYGDNSGVITIPDGQKISTDNVSEDMRQIGIHLAFGMDDSGNYEYPDGNNPNVKWPSITESGEYVGGIPETDPDQGFPDVENTEDDDWWSDNEENDW